MNSMRISILLAAVLALTACGTTKVLDTWESDSLAPEEPEKLAVLVAWPDELERLVIEKDMVAKLRKSGANAVSSAEIHGMRGELTPSSVEVALRNANVDGLVIVFVVGGGGGDTYQRSDYWAQQVGSGVSGYGWYSPYYYNYYDVYVVREGPGYAEKTTQIFLETTYIDIRKLDRVWSLITQTKDVEYQDVASNVTDRVISQMKHSGQL